ncbi:MAG: LamG domain-containing protein, partial [Candidatus Korobacteraceae bacterium]
MVADSPGIFYTAPLSDGVRWFKGANEHGILGDAANRDSVSIPAIDLSGTRAVTISLWANRTYSAVGDDVLFEATSNYQNSTTGFAFLPDSDVCHGVQAALRGNEGTTANCYTQPSSGIWHHLALVFDKSQTGGNEVAFYIDGVLQSPAWSLSASTNTNSFGNDPIYLFSRGGISKFSSGAVDDLRVYNRALTAAQIQWVYNGSRLESPSNPINYVQGNYATPQTLQTMVNVTFTAAQGAGDLNVVVVGWHDSTATVSTVSDSMGNAYARAVGPTVVRGALSQSIYYAKNIASASAGANSVTVTFSSAAVHPDIRILEYSGADPANPVDVTATDSGSSSSSSSGSATTTNTTDLIFGANIVATRTTGPGSGFTERLLTSPDGDIAEDRMVTATGRYSTTTPISPVGQWIMQMVAFRAVPNFTISASPASLSIAQGNHGTSTITTSVSGGFSSSITLSATGAPTGTTVTFNPQTIPAPGSGSSTMTITVGSSTRVGRYPITVTGNGGGIQRSTTVTLTVTAAGNFTISASPRSLSVAQGNQGTSTITTTVSGGFSSSISLSASGVPTGTTVSFNPQTIPAPGSGSSTMTITVGASTLVGRYPITVTGNGGGIQQSTTVTLTVTAAGNFTISASPRSLSIAQGNHGISTITTS